MAENETPAPAGKRKRERSAPVATNFRIIEVSKRPHLEMVIRRDVDKDGQDTVVCEMFVPRGGDAGEAWDWNHSEEVNFGQAGIEPLRAYIATYSDEAARAFYLRAKAAAEKNSLKDPE